MKIISLLTLLIWGTLAQAQTATATSGNTTAIAKVPSTQTKTTKSSSSVSISNSDDSYSLLANFDVSKTKKIEKLLSDNLDNDMESTERGSKIWKKDNNGETAYSFVLKEGKLKVSIDKELVSNETFEKLQALGDKISETLSKN
ncbi:hypothetical protein CLU81_4922 [Flavobacterium sp. 9]|uniref:hypothetical protein n=1 Tax=Flavobacterium sp. 9 TaxID=2035198 RepID=UPI000C18CD2B|nr:hypothetical protein [Flavobacterium sp. 9]PIF34284.1 hypothetical protein CLU81_4922 [Flavobacterium sp. 9]